MTALRSSARPHYVLDGSDRDLARLLRIAEVQAESARAGIARAGDVRGWRAVECGCGPLGALAVLADAVGPDGRVVGIDFSEPTVARARAAVASLGLVNVELRTVDVHDVDPIAIGAPFDLAFTRAFLMHQTDPARTLASIAELLRPGGWLIVQEPLRDPAPRSAPALPALERYWELMHEVADSSGVAPDAVARLTGIARAAGFALVATNGFFNVVEPAIGLDIHAAAVAALRDRAVGAGVASTGEVDALERALAEASAGSFEWVTTPFMLELTLRKGDDG